VFLDANLLTLGERVMKPRTATLLAQIAAPPVVDTEPGCRSASEPANEPRLGASQRRVILFLAANPAGMDRLALDREARAIEVELERSGHRDRFAFVTRWAAEPLDLLRELRRLRPTVLHFKGHGERPSEPARGLYFQGSDGSPRVVPSTAVRDAIAAAGSSVKLVVLSACYSEQQADELLTGVDCVVGMSGATGDDAAQAFAVGFYGGLAEQESVAAAYRQGRVAIRLHGLDDAVRPKLKVRDGVDADHLVLAAGPR
jgi:hypothetical protein